MIHQLLSSLLHSPLSPLSTIGRHAFSHYPQKTTELSASNPLPSSKSHLKTFFFDQQSPPPPLSSTSSASRSATVQRFTIIKFMSSASPPLVCVAILTAKIRNYQEHLHKHTKDKANKRYMLLAIDQRKKLLKYLRRTRYELFENVCTQLDIQYTFPPKYYRKVTRRWVAKKALCIRSIGGSLSVDNTPSKKKQIPSLNPGLFVGHCCV
uniref:Small ribosomal subunit protein uS15m n=1 Tax=Callorhinchus milii TaxID=7868 RepID=A0A4W3IV21_CALMI